MKTTTDINRTTDITRTTDIKRANIAIRRTGKQ